MNFKILKVNLENVNVRSLKVEYNIEIKIEGHGTFIY